MRIAMGILAGAVLLLASCSGDSGDTGGTNDNKGSGGETTGEQASGPLAGLDGDTLCGLVDKATVEALVGEEIVDQLGGINPPEQRSSVICDYLTRSFAEADNDDLAAAPKMTVKVTAARDGDGTAEEALDAYLTNLDGEVLAFQPVDGLGAAAGFAGSEFEPLGGGSQLAAIIEVDGALVEVVAKLEPTGTLDQLRPVADELVKGVEAELR